MIRQCDNEPSLVSLENMTGADIRWNIQRLRSEADAASKHADALEQFGKTKFSNREVQNEQK